jgi:hypothetical protein
LTVNNEADLEFLTNDSEWGSITILPKWEGREAITYKLHFPVYFMVRPGLENTVQVALTGLQKLKDNGNLIWDSLAKMEGYRAPPQVVLSDWAC